MSNRIPHQPNHLSLGGQLLVATARCDDSMLQGTVCLVLHHGEEGSMGLVLNKSIDFEVGGLWKFLKAPEQKPHRVVRFGGPMSGPILALHNQEQWAEVCAASGVYIAAHVDKLQKLVAAQQAKCVSSSVRFCGKSGSSSKRLSPASGCRFLQHLNWCLPPKKKCGDAACAKSAIATSP